MEKKKRQEYAARITQANRTQLLVIMYEMIQEELKQALWEYDQEEMELFDGALKNAGKFLGELMGTLDYKYSVSYELMSIYKFVNKVIIEARLRGQTTNIDRCIQIIENLKVGYEEIVSEDQSGPVMANVQKLYAGLTYGKGALNEISVNVNDSARGLYA